MDVTNNNIRAHRYSNEWKKVKNLISQKLTKTAYKELQKIHERACKAKNELQMLKSALFLAQFESDFVEDHSFSTLSRFKSLIPLLSGERKAICYALIGNFYREYYLINKWKIPNLTTTEHTKENFQLWSEHDFKEAIFYNLLLSVSYNSIKTGKTPVSKYHGILSKGSNKGEKLRPFLLDILLENAFWDINPNISIKELGIFDNPLLYGSSKEFLELVDSLDKSDRSYWNIEIAGRLTRSHIDSNWDIRASIDLKRMKILKESRLLNNELYLEGVKKLALEYIDYTPLSTDFLSDAARILLNSQKNIAAKELCKLAVERYPNTLGGVECQNIIYEILRKELSFSLWTDLIPYNINLGQLNIKNIDKIYFSAVRTSQEYDLSGKNLITLLCSMEKESSWEHSIDVPRDYNFHSIPFITPSLQPGDYYILASDNPLFNTTSIVSYLYCRCSILEFIHQIFSNNSVEGFVINRKTGKSISDCRYIILQKQDYGDNESLPKEILQGFSDENGYISTGPLPSGTYEIHLEYLENHNLFSFYLPQRVPTQTIRVAKLFTDRFSYKAGDIICFKGIVYKCNGYSIGKTKQGQQVKVILRNSNWQEIDMIKAITDRFGGVSGEFVIPFEVNSGQFTLQILDEEGSFTSNRTINVTTNRQPSFFITLNTPSGTLKLKSKIKISGSAKYISGFPVENAKVHYRIIRESVVPYWRFFINDNSVTEISRGETITTNEGYFSFNFFSEPDSNKKTEDELFFKYHVIVDITDIKRETIGVQTSLNIGWQNSHIDITTPDNVLKEAVIEASINDLIGNVLKGTIQIKVEKLYVPPKPQISISELINIETKPELCDSIKKAFPLYSFNQDNDPNFWSVENEVFKGTIHSREKGDIGQVHLNLKNGVYRVTASSQVEEGIKNEIRHFTVFNPDLNKTVCNKLLFAIPDKETYFVGETATLFIGSGFKNSNVLYFIENRFGLSSCGSLSLSEETKQLTVPITEDMSGGFIIKLAAICERVSVYEQLHLNVPFTTKELKVSFVTFKDLIEPKADEIWKIKIEEDSGLPADATLILSLFNAALDIYGSNEWLFSPWRDASLNSDPLLSGKERLSSYYQETIQNKLYSGETTSFASIIPTSSIYLDNSLPPTLYRTGKTLNVFYESSLITPFVINPKESIYEEIQSNEKKIRVFVDKNKVIQHNINQTGFFYPNLITDKNGEIEISFKAPELIAKWNLKGLAYTTNLKNTSFLRQIVTRKEIIIETKNPKFFRCGEIANIDSEITNLTESTIKVLVELKFFNPLNEEPIKIIQDEYEKTITIPEKSKVSVNFRCTIPNKFKVLNYNIKASSDRHTDIKHNVIQIISDKT